MICKCMTNVYFDSKNYTNKDNATTPAQKLPAAILAAPDLGVVAGVEPVVPVDPPEPVVPVVPFVVAAFAEGMTGTKVPTGPVDAH